MTNVSIRFMNYNDEPINIQVEPVAGFYVLNKGEEIEIVSESETSSASFALDENGSTRYLTIYHNDEYFIVLNGKRVHCSQYLTKL
jgi:hypothetical protein